MMSMWMSLRTTTLRSLVDPLTSYTDADARAGNANAASPMLPKMMPFSVDATLTVALMLQKSWGASTTGVGFSTSFRSPTSGSGSPRVASSSVQFWRVSAVWFTTSTSRAMSYWLTCT
ncbi:unnamed protein product [Ixodes pacificus]